MLAVFVEAHSGICLIPKNAKGLLIPRITTLTTFCSPVLKLSHALRAELVVSLTKSKNPTLNFPQMLNVSPVSIFAKFFNPSERSVACSITFWCCSSAWATVSSFIFFALAKASSYSACVISPVTYNLFSRIDFVSLYCFSAFLIVSSFAE